VRIGFMRSITRLLLALSCSALLAPLRLGAADAPPPALVREVLADGVYLFRAPQKLDFWTATNVVAVVNDDDVVVFDSNSRASTARQVIAEIKKITPKPVRTLINSHWHQDHWTGNDEYVKAFPGLRIVATQETRDFMTVMGPRFFADEVGLPELKAEIEKALQTGKNADGSPLTPEMRTRKESLLRRATQFIQEVLATPRVLPNVAYKGALTFWCGTREFRLTSQTGDATASTILYLPAEKILVTGDVLVAPEDGNGSPPWTTNTFSISPWIASLRYMDGLDTKVIVPGQGPAFHDKVYLERTIRLFQTVVDQVHAALLRGLLTPAETEKAVNVEPIAREYTKDGSLGEDYGEWFTYFVKKVHQEQVDGALSIR
jgi:glyoxylase-like metal-dependent hydrolase (beta-lactamase superfamily II)